MKKAILIIGLSLMAGNLFAFGKYDQQTWKAAQPSTSTIDGTVTVTNERWQAGDFNIGISTFDVYIKITSTGQIKKLIGAYLDISTNVYIVGYASAAYFYGDGSNLTNIAVTGDNLGNHTATEQLKMGSYSILTSSGITGLKRIVWDDGTIQVSSPTAGVGNGGQPDIKFSYMGNVFNSTSPWKFTPETSAYAFTTARYDIDIGSATTDGPTIRFAKKSFGGTYSAFEDVAIPVGVSSHTFVSSGVAIADGDIVIWGFMGVSDDDPFGDITVIIRD